MIKKLWPFFQKIGRILGTYSDDDKTINEVKELFNSITNIMFNKEFKISYKECPCKSECEIP